MSYTSVNLGAPHRLQVLRRAQFTFPHLAHCQSSAENKPCTKKLPASKHYLILSPHLRLFRGLTANLNPLLLHLVNFLLHPTSVTVEPPRKVHVSTSTNKIGLKMLVTINELLTFAYCGSGHVQSPSEGLKSPPIARTPLSKIKQTLLQNNLSS